VAFSATVLGGTGPFGYTWLFENGTRATGQNTSHAFGSAGNYTVRVYANDSFGLSATDTALVTVFPQLSATLVVSNAMPLLGQSIAFVTNASGGVAPYSYSYLGLPAGCSSANVSAFACTPSASGTFSVEVIVLDANGFKVTRNVTLTVNTTVLGLSASEGYDLIGGITALVAVAAVVAVMVLSRRKRKAPPKPPRPPASSGEEDGMLPDSSPYTFEPTG
jgi:PKD repeat protein